MGLFDRFREKSHLEVKTNVASIVQQMFDEAGITPQCPDKNVFLTVIDGVHCSFKTILKCDEENPNKLFIYAPFPIPVPKHVAGLIPHELNRLNEKIIINQKLPSKKTVENTQSLPLLIVSLRKPLAPMRCGT